MEKCSHCNAELEDGHTGPCPVCGKKGKKISVTVQDGIKVTNRLVVKHSWMERHWKAILLSVGLVIFTGVIGLFHWLGTGIGIIIGLVGIWFLPAPKEKYSETG